MPPFHLSGDILGIAAALVALYEVGVWKLAPVYCPEDETPVTTTKRVLFYAGVITLAVALSWPVHDIGEQRLYLMHMVQHTLVQLIAAPMLLGGMPWWLTRALVAPILPLVKFVTRPLVAIVLFNGWLAFTHVPAVVELMSTNDMFHRVAHGLLFLTAIIVWWPVLDPIPDTARLTPFGKMGYLFVQSLVPTIPASFLTLGSTPLYPIYETFPRLWGIGAMTDQVIGGLIMKIGGGLILWGFIAWTFFSWYADEQRYEPGPVVVPTKQPSS